MIISSNLTPDKKEKKESVPRDQWQNLTVNELIDQKNLLMDRLIYLNEAQVSYAKIFEQAINDLDALIASKNLF